MVNQSLVQIRDDRSAHRFMEKEILKTPVVMTAIGVPVFPHQKLNTLLRERPRGTVDGGEQKPNKVLTKNPLTLR